MSQTGCDDVMRASCLSQLKPKGRGAVWLSSGKQEDVFHARGRAATPALTSSRKACYFPLCKGLNEETFQAGVPFCILAQVLRSELVKV